MKHGKKYIESSKLVDRAKLYEPAEALETVRRLNETEKTYRYCIQECYN